MTTEAFSAFSVEPFPRVSPGDELGSLIALTVRELGISLREGDVIVVASKVVSVSEERRVDLTSVTPGPSAVAISARTGKPAEVVQVILDESDEHFVVGDRGPIVAWHRLGYQLTSAGVDRDGPDGVWLLPADPDASARRLRDAISAMAGVNVAVVIADSDGRADRLGSTVIAIGAAGIAPLRVTEDTEPEGRGKRQAETAVDLVAAAAGIILGQRGRGAPVAVIRGVEYQASDEGVRSILHRAKKSAEPVVR
ncbi:coenzyme F420-0:L-glutamate ligase [Actinomadura violacea]|uniref:Coenzyme F420-0:L-glutamate ligase n=1 Tax=Actinomadura violacea TaxID=2819934 RepID=A0ABS3SB49_9ACTN|nr:coenzyme F420-0:L-glutamate ligase [Actinomadura violacea]MBO2466244.1 coenzyme F420-0:L-glutamate ligase [Actinomadura violacea]